ADGEAVGLPGDIEGAVGGRGEPRGHVAAAAPPRPVPDQVAVRGELDHECGEIDDAALGLLETTRDVDGAVGRYGESAARVGDLPRGVGPLPEQGAVGRDLQ